MGLIIRTAGGGNSRPNLVRSLVKVVEEKRFYAEDIEGAFKGGTFPYGLTGDLSWEFLPQDTPKEYPLACYDEKGALRTPEKDYQWLKVGEIPKEGDFALIGNQKYTPMGVVDALDATSPSFCRRVAPLPRWINGSEVRPGMTIVGNCNSAGNLDCYMYTCKVVSTDPKVYDTGSNEIFSVYFKGTFLTRKSEEVTTFGLVWSHREYLLIAQEDDAK